MDVVVFVTLLDRSYSVYLNSVQRYHDPTVGLTRIVKGGPGIQFDLCVERGSVKRVWKSRETHSIREHVLILPCPTSAVSATRDISYYYWSEDFTGQRVT